MHQSIPAAPSPEKKPTPLPSEADTRALAFFCLGWQIPRVRDSSAVKSPAVGDKKRGQHCNIFH